MAAGKKKKTKQAVPYTMPQLLLAAVGGLLAAVFYGLSKNPTALPGSDMGGILSLMMHLPLFFVGLAMGVVPIVIAVVAGAIGTVLTAPDMMDTLKFLLIAGLPSGGLTYLALQSRPLTKKKVAWYPADRLNVALSLYGLVLVPLLYKVHADNPEPLRQLLGLMLETIQLPAPVTADQAFPVFLVVYVGITIMNLLILLLSNGIMAQYILVKFKKNLRPSLNIKELVGVSKLSILFLICFAGASISSTLLGSIAEAWAIVLLLPLILIGLAMFHRFLENNVGNKGYRIVLLTLLYIVLVSIPLFPFMGLGIVAIIALFGLIKPLMAEKKGA